MYFITDVNGLSVDISPIPASVIVGDNLIVTSTIIKTVSETWKAFTFYISNGDGYSACGGTFTVPSACTDFFGCPYGFGFTCNYTHFNLLINNVGMLLLGLSIYAEVTFTNSFKVNSKSTTLEIISKYYYKRDNSCHRLP